MVVYNVETGEAFECESVDAKELIASGAYSESPKEEKPKKRGRPASKADEE